MDIRFNSAIGLFGYMIIANEEIHSRQIKWLDHILTHYELTDSKNLVKDILDDTDEKISFNDCILSFQRESKETKAFIYRTCFQLAIVDDNNIVSSKPDQQEDRILRGLESYLEKVNIFSQQRQARKSIDKSAFSNEENSFGLDFDVDIDTLLAVASGDHDIYKSVFSEIFDECKKLSSRLENKLNIIESPLLRSALEEFLSEYREKVMTVLSDLEAESSKKELAAHNFSIALMGRTKAGKSTLHYVMCKEGKNFIGKGKQRTTRFNRVFSWNGLKIIDTPGIGAGEGNGKKDEEIALRVLSQADIVCFVLIDDTIQNDILELLDKIAEYHKPMLIVLNHKEDIRKKSHLKTFLDDPDNWRVTKGEANLAGYVNRLNRNAVKHNYDKLMRVVPVFLLAAQIGNDEHDSLMYKASNFPAFIEALRSLVRENSLIYKSQTMLDEPSIRLHKAYKILKVEYDKLCALQSKIQEIRNRILDNIESSRKSILFEAIRSIKQEYDDFYTAKSYTYTEENYEEKNPVALRTAFDKLFSDYRVKEHIKDILYEYNSSYCNSISGIASEVNEELNYAKLNINDLFGGNFASIKGNQSIFSFREIFKAASMILDVISIVHPLLAIISIPVSLVGSFSKPKAEKIKDAKNSTAETFKILLNYSCNQVTKNAKEELEKKFRNDRNKIKEFFDTLEDVLGEIVEFVASCCNEFDSGIKKFDMCLANRILQYISPDPRGLLVMDAERDFDNNTFIIYVSRDRYMTEINTSKYQKISTEKIAIKYVDK